MKYLFVIASLLSTAALAEKITFSNITHQYSTINNNVFVQPNESIQQQLYANGIALLESQGFQLTFSKWNQERSLPKLRQGKLDCMVVFDWKNAQDFMYAPKPLLTNQMAMFNQQPGKQRYVLEEIKGRRIGKITNQYIDNGYLDAYINILAQQQSERLIQVNSHQELKNLLNENKVDLIFSDLLNWQQISDLAADDVIGQIYGYGLACSNPKIIEKLNQ